MVFMFFVQNVQLLSRGDVLETYFFNEAGNAITVALLTLIFEPGRHPGNLKAWPSVTRILPVNKFHKPEIEVGDVDWLVVKVRPVET